MLGGESALRFARQIILKEVRTEGQEKLSSAKVLVVGAGGLGSAALYYLAAAGVGTLGVVDYDRVELHNLQRQILHKAGRLGMEKALSAEKTLRELDPAVHVIAYPERLTVGNAEELLGGYDFILDCTDRFGTKFLINDACVLLKKPYSHAGVVRFGGQAMTYVPGQGPCLRCLLGTPPNGDTCAEVGVMGAAVGVLGSIQAMEAIKYLLGVGELLVGRVLHFDGLKSEVVTARFGHADPHCAVCGKTPIHSFTEHAEEYEI